MKSAVRILLRLLVLAQSGARLQSTATAKDECFIEFAVNLASGGVQAILSLAAMVYSVFLLDCLMFKGECDLQCLSLV